MQKTLQKAKKKFKEDIYIKKMKNSKSIVQNNETTLTPLPVLKSFKIDYSKVKSLEQLIDILKTINLSIHWYDDECPEQFKDLYEKGLLKEVDY